MADTAFKRATYEDILALPENVVGEIVNGVLHVQPRPAPAHVITASKLSGELEPPFGKAKGGPGGWVFATEPELHLGAEVMVPDMAGWRKEAFELPQTAFFEQPPDWICELLSPSTARHDRINKMTHYREFGVVYAWLIDPVAKTLEAYRVSDGQWLQIAALGEKGSVKVDPFDAISFNLEALWVS
ncbi:MAG: Uma2 family endonuclease [Pseudomonadota bacterium]